MPRDQAFAKAVLALLAGGSGLALLALLSKRAAAANQPVNQPTTISPSGTQFISSFEGFNPNLHNDPVGHCSIGFGHLVHLGPCNGSEPAEFKRGITREQGLNLLANEATKAAKLINTLVKVALNQTQFDALISFVFNVGEGNFRSSTLLKLLNKGDYASVPGQLNRFVFAKGQRLPGLVRRREAEGRLFARGDYGLVS